MFNFELPIFGVYGKYTQKGKYVKLLTFRTSYFKIHRNGHRKCTQSGIT